VLRLSCTRTIFAASGKCTSDKSLSVGAYSMAVWRHPSSCLDRRIANKQIVPHEVRAWQGHRNNHHAKAIRQFQTADARVKLKRLYPQFG
jgi:hypothetical protein